MAWIPLACARKLLASAAGEAQAPNRRDVWAGPSMFPVLFLPFLPLDDAGRMILDRMHSAPWSVSILRRSVFPLEYQGMPPVLAPFAKLFGRSNQHSHSPEAERGSENVLHAVMDGTTGPPCSFGRVDAWLFSTVCQEIQPFLRSRR